MPKFNPDAYLAKSSKSFDPDKYLSAQAPSEQAMSPLKAAQVGAESGILMGARPIVSGAGSAIGSALAEYQQARGKDVPVLEALKRAAGVLPAGYEEGRKEAVSEQAKAFEQHPKTSIASGIAGGLATAPLIPINSLKGAIAYGAGTGALTGIGEDKGLVGTAGEAAKGGLLSAVPYGLGKLASGTGKAVEGVTKEFAESGGQQLRPDAEQIIEAAKRLGVEPTKGMLSAGKTVPGLESSLEQSPTAFGWMTRQKTEPVRKALSEGAEGVVAARSGLDPFQAGTEVKRGLMAKLGEKLDPLQAKYGAIAQETSQVPLNQKSVDKVVDKLSQLREVRLAGPEGASVLNNVGMRLKNAKNVDELKDVISVVGRQVGAEQDPVKRQVLGKIYDRLRSFEGRSLVEAGKEAGGEDLAKGLLRETKQVRKGYRELGKEVEKGADILGAQKGKTLPQSMSNIDELQSEGLFKKAFNTNDVGRMTELKGSFPEQFDVLKNAKLQELYDKSLVKGKFSPESFMRQVKGIPESARELMFGADKAKLSDIQTLVNARPDMIGPSGTPQGMAFLNMFSPTQNLQDLLRYGYYSKGGMSEKAVKGITKGAQALQKGDKAAKGLIRGLMGAYPVQVEEQ